MALIIAPAFDPVYELLEAKICNIALGTIGAELIRNTLEDTKQARLCRTVYPQTRDELLRNYPFNFAVKTALIPEDTAYAYPMDEYSYAYKLLDYKEFTVAAALVGVTTLVIDDDSLVVDASLIGRALTPNTVIAENTRIVGIKEAVVAPATPAPAEIYLDRPTILAITDPSATQNMSVFIPMLKLNEIAANDNNIFDVIGGGSSRRVLCNIVSEVSTVPENMLEIMYVEQVIDPNKFDSMFSHALSLRIASKVAMDLTKDPRMVQLMQQEFAAIFQSAKISSSEERQLESPDPWWTDRAQDVPARSRG